jgi:hypothetical protein
VAGPRRFRFDFRRFSRWCLLGTFVMFVWLIAPVVKCSFVAFRDTPLSETQPDLAPSSTDTERVEQSEGFVSSVVSKSKVCYARTPLLGQEGWKTKLFLGFAGATLLAWVIHTILMRRRRTLG